WLDRAGGGVTGPRAARARAHRRRADSRGAGGRYALCPRDGLPTIDRRLGRDQAALSSRTPYGLESTKRSEQSVGTPSGSGGTGSGRAPEELAAPARGVAPARGPRRGQRLAVPDRGAGGARRLGVQRLLPTRAAPARRQPALRGAARHPRPWGRLALRRARRARTAGR